ncbi:Eco57I restriction-modification methylase domain-containing protein [Desulfonatronum parangueonense]
MSTLEKSLRNKLEKTVKDARDIAEAAAKASLEQLGVKEPSAYAHLTEDERSLRRALRAHARQLGNGRGPKGEQEVDRLIEEVAYEHWHRMLFARFLAENNLLMYPDPDDPVAVSLEECEDLAADEGAANGWELASRYAARMLPQIFRPDSPVFRLTLPPEHQHKLERLVADLPLEVFTASDSLGWVYQFWQAKKKDEVNASEVKIGARELPAVTQLFTEPYMVSFLLDNSLGAWWAARRLTEADLKNASTEEELRQKASIPGVPLEYLRFVQQEDGSWTPAAGTFDGWPKQLADLKSLDPCCGSGHFLVAAFLMLVAMRMELEGLSAQEAVNKVLSENIHGLEIDQRCVALAAFALALTAWTYPDAGGYRPLPELNLACSGLAVSAAKEQWTSLAPPQTKLRNALDLLYDDFQQASILGSLLNPSRGIAANLVDMHELAPILQKNLSQEESLEKHEAAIAAQGLAKAAAVLIGQYHLVITNVPYLARSKQDETLREFCAQYYPKAKNDLATVFLDRCLELCVQGGTVSVVLPQNWLFLTGYKKFREKLLKKESWHLVARLGPGAFETISGEVVKAILITLNRGNSTLTPSFSQKEKKQIHLPWGEGTGSAVDGLIRGLDVSKPRTAIEKAAQLIVDEINSVEQARQLENQDARVTFEKMNTSPLLMGHGISVQGLATSDDPQFTCLFWELISISNEWTGLRGTVENTTYFGGCERLLLWENCNGRYFRHAMALKEAGRLGGWKSGTEARGKKGIIISQMSKIPVSIYYGEFYDHNACVLVPNDQGHLSALWCYMSNNKFYDEVRLIDQSLKPSNNTFLAVPFDLDHWSNVAEGKYPNGLPKPHSDDPTQWIFHGHPSSSVIWDEEQKWTAHGPLRTDHTVLHVAIARLLGYRWPAELDTDMELATEQREWVNRCDTLLPFADDDGIVCIAPVRGEASATDRLLNLLAAAYGDAWSSDTLAALLKSVDHAGKTLETWLREKFFTQHCKLFHHRPFIWHIWDGLRDGFAALVNYHKLDRKNLETLIYTYLGDWISRQKQDIAGGVDGAQERLAAAENLKKSLELILEGEAPFDIFVRWKPLDKQPIGWEPDLNDGVRLNIRPFLSVPDVGKRGAGVLRDKPNINWNKDRGKDVESAPWFHLFKGDRINDHHLTLAEKR